MGLGKVRAQLAKCLTQKHENLSVVPGTHVKKTGLVIRACNPRGEAADTEGLPRFGHESAWSIG